MEDFITQKHLEIKNRIKELAPLADEYQRLVTADNALDAALNSSRPSLSETTTTTVAGFPKPKPKRKRSAKPKRTNKYSEEFRQKTIAKAQETNPGEAAREAGVSRNTVRNWLKSSGVIE